MVEVRDIRLLPDDDEQNRTEDGDTEFKHPPFTRKHSDPGRAAFERELKDISNPDASVVMLILKSVEGHVYWKGTFNLLTLAMLCRLVYSSGEFYCFDLTIHFESVNVFNGAPWRDINLLPLGVIVPESDEIDGKSEGDENALRVGITVKGWDNRRKQGKERLKEVEGHLLRTVRKNCLQVYAGTWYTGLRRMILAIGSRLTGDNTSGHSGDEETGFKIDGLCIWFNKCRLHTG